MNEIIHNSILEELAEDPAEAVQLRLKSRLMNAIVNHIDKEGLTQDDASRLMNVQRTQVGNVCDGRVDKVTIDSLVAMAARLGLDPLRSVA